MNLIALSAALKNFICPNTTIIEGFSRKFTFIGFEWELLTLNIYSNECTNRRDVIISPRENIEFEALIMASAKNISFLPVKVSENFSNLLIYDAHDCSIKEVRYVNFKNLTKLEVVKLNKNKISYLDKDSFKDLENLRELFLNENFIQFIDMQIFKPVRNLRYLQLDNNQISFLSKHAFNNLLKLEHIMIGHNLLEKLVDEHFKSNKKLITIWLEKNFIYDLNSTMFDHLYNLQYIDLKNNICIDDYYIQENFLKMKETLKINCTN